jgi:HEAT repeat protein
MPPLPLPFSNKSLADWIGQFQQADVSEDRLRALQAISVLASSDDLRQWSDAALHDSDSTVRALAAKLTGTAGNTVSSQTQERLVTLLADSDPDTRFEAARAMIRSRSSQQDQAVPVLFAFLDEEETQPLMVAAVIDALVLVDSMPDLPASHLLPRLRSRLTDERAEVREAIAVAFAKWPIMCRTVVEELLSMLDDSEPVVREKIAFALGKSGINSENVRSCLKVTAEDEDSEVARVAMEALLELDRDDPGPGGRSLR